MANYSTDYKNLPRSPKTYFDANTDEYKDISLHKKLLDIGCSLWNGLDLLKVIKRLVADHNHLANYEKDVINTLALFIEKLRTGDTKQGMLSYKIITEPVVDGKPVRKLTLKGVVDLFVQELLLRYRPHYLVECYWDYDDLISNYNSETELTERFYTPTPATRIPISEKEIREINPWKDISKYVNAVPGTIYEPHSTWLLKEDEFFIQQFNVKYKNTNFEFILDIKPEAFGGNPLTSKVVVLSLNPGFVERVSHTFAKLLKQIPKLEEKVNGFKNDQLFLDAKSFTCKHPIDNGFISATDAQCMLDDWYWYDIFEKFCKEAKSAGHKIDIDTIFDNISLIQYVGYSSKSWKDLPSNIILPSQRFTRLLIHHLAINKKDVLFVVSRAEKLWKKLIGDDIWNMLEKEKRLVHRKVFTNKNGKEQTTRNQDFGQKSFKDDGFERILKYIINR